MKLEFKSWLKEVRGLTLGTVNSYSSAISKISEHYSKYAESPFDIYRIIHQTTIDDIRHDYSQGGRFSEFGDKQHGRFRAAIIKYSEFLEDRNAGRNKSLGHANTKDVVKCATAGEHLSKDPSYKQIKQNHELFKFPDLSNSVDRRQATILGEITHHIHPDICNYIADKNLTYREEFQLACHKLCNLSSFFYEGSDCVFPGFRRPINKEKKRPKWKNNVFEKDGTILNDNTFPRHIWAFLSQDKAYSGGRAGMWQSSCLGQFELAHIFSHKQDERNLEKKVFRSFDNKQEPYGLFTSASNVVLIPKGFPKPTDHRDSIRICFYVRRIDLYGSNIVGLDDLDESLIPDWYPDIEWLEPLLPSDWKEKIDHLLDYRTSYLAKKYDR